MSLETTYTVGSVLDGRWELREHLRSTPTVRVFRAIQRSTSQPVVVKLVDDTELPRSRRSELLRRFQREASVLAALSHPNIVRMIDTGKTPQGVYYIVIDDIHGATLGDMIARNGSLDPFVTRDLMVEVLDTLAAIHVRGIIHRDVQPSNIIVSRSGVLTHARLDGFDVAGIERRTWLGESHNGRRPITSPGQALGTPAYMAPEAIRGSAEPTSDLYAWGLVYLEALTGKRAVEGLNDMMLLFNQMNTPTPIPEWLVGTPLGQILVRTTAKAVSERFSGAAELMAAVKACPMSDLALRRDPVSDITAAVREESKVVEHGFIELPTRKYRRDLPE